MLDRGMDKTDPNTVPHEPHYSAYPDRINIDDETILANWSQRLGCSRELLKEAVFDVGDDPNKVAAFIADRTAHPYDPSGSV
jgi:hypothetical protein